ncbi:DUF2254 domain-containing protein [Salegentibacter sediminis]|uniref:DUF2254 domain-containing protein n=1 Tax=Salegentibacter sediminis TaxID=1930251 RepID=UPI0009BC8A41|nr:DUF2254 domain-containing protein [Salegentibacter sediminis]
MKQIWSNLSSVFHSIQSKIAFYPSLFAIFGFLLAFVMIYAENRGISAYLMDNIPTLVVNNGDTALTILSACITGLISMMVFSFSMVMVLLNQASTNYSPRLLPGLISDKKHQVILGVYLATILYCIFIAISIQPHGEDYQVPGFSVLLGIVFTVICIWAFIYFIHTISQSIQINNILDGIYQSAKKRLNYLIEDPADTTGNFPDTQEWPEYYAEKSGYFQYLNLENLKAICDQEEIDLQILPVKGVFVLKGIPLFKTSKKLEKETIKKIQEAIVFSRAELVSLNYALAFKQITEIIVKAMSPGINDPGTAMNGIDYLTELFAMRMQKNDSSVHITNNEHRIKFNVVTFSELMYNVMASLRTYCKQDIIIIQKLSLMFQYLENQQSIDQAYHKVITKEAKALMQDAFQEISNQGDQKLLRELSEKLHLKVNR